MNTKIQELYNQMTDQYSGGLSNTSTAKFRPLIGYIKETYGLTEGDVYVTGAGTRPGNLEVRLSQGVQATTHTLLGVCFIVDEKNTSENREKLTKSAFVTVRKSINRGKASYDTILILVVSNDTVFPMGIISKQNELCNRIVHDLEIALIEIVDENDAVEIDNQNRQGNMMSGINNDDSLQMIFFGSPGTGKSNTIEERTNDTNRIRTTFHPDSDYSTFVGAYKPTMEETGELHPNGDKKSIITYSFVPQAFLKAYVNAWMIQEKEKEPHPYYLVIEEINRGNCAQIFGDLFQLLDRGPNRDSKYDITPDDDIRRHLADQFKDCTNLPTDIKAGEKMRLPNNLYIWATMNTSDQSLFPIDSAFKRRWDWEYVPIEDGKKGFYIDIDGKKYDWWNFIETINKKIDSITGSEDKKLGYWFAKPAGDSIVITQKQFISKVLFYLWNDVYKDYADSTQSIFRKKVENKEEKLPFTSFFGEKATENILAFMKYNGVKFEGEDAPSVTETPEQA